MADVKMNIGQIKLGSIVQTSGVFVGSTIQAKWSSTKKENNGFGDTSGNYNRTLVDAKTNDSDALDTLRMPRLYAQSISNSGKIAP
ncbi:hypothetical protein [Sulfoacidibacillus thermotolerans]|uniref:Uncharacterized protein n=1 Tax=Sulfoacidibacillus thermotolerans TaxID=1765684 RepID=A0A2U3D8L3_SULT2|nr:hypothetical protein [Sulfoacidibacillus thermotolerans]PWI57612.1 hypothetical protein BM613_07390 [Sulfoacidibacillus thermotolerans]